MTAAERVAGSLVAGHPEDAARLLERADPADAAALLASLPPSAGAEVLRRLGPSPAGACAALLPVPALAAIVDGLPPDSAASMVRGLEPSRRAAVLEGLDAERSRQLLRLLAYPEHTAGALADPLVLTLPEDLTIADAQRQLRGAHRHLFYYVYVVARDQTLVGVLAMPELMAARLKDSLHAVMRRDVVRLDARADLVTVAVHPAWRDFDALPVTDLAGRLVGAIRHKIIRRMSRPQGTPMMAALVGLSELYWTGLSGILASLGRRTQGTGQAPVAGEATDVP